jgi:ABC-type phosphate transport system substrate-binding protein
MPYIGFAQGKKIACCLILLIMLVVTRSPGYAMQDDLRGTVFAEPGQIYDMPAEWREQPIKYEPAEADADLVVTLGQHLYPYLSPAIQKYAEKHSLKIITNQGTCGITSGKLTRKVVDIGGFCCASGETDRLPGLQFHTLGIAALMLIVHPENPVNNLDLDEARKIFMGEFINWSEVGSDNYGKGRNMHIQPVARLHCKLRPGHWKLLLADEDLFSPAIRDVGAIPDMIYSVSSNPKAIGYETMTSVHRYFENAGNMGVRPLRINGYTHAEPANILNKKYPLYRVFNLTTWKGEHVANQHAQKLIRFLLKEVEHLDKRLGIIPSSQLREAGWKFHGNELSGEPE